MRTRQISDIAASLGGRRVGADVCVRGAIVDSRLARPGDLFFALPGERRDGHRFVGDALRRGAAAVVREASALRGSGIVVPEPGAALLHLARLERDEAGWTVIGVTGSVGKTSTKDFAQAVLGGRFRVRASPESFNNRIGVPLTMLGATDRTEILVCEMGAGAGGEIAELCRIARPQIGIVTAVGAAHLETFGSRRNVARAKAELVEALPNNGVAILNADDPIVRRFGSRTGARVLTFGRADEADTRAENVALDHDGRPRFVLRWRGERAETHLPIPGEHMVTSALAAAATGLALDLPLRECARGLECARLSPWRMELFETPGHVRVLNDAYNANPTSVGAALRALRAMSNGGRAFAVLGDMAELGTFSRTEHERVGRLVAQLRIDWLVTVGAEAREIARSAVSCGMDADRVQSYDEIEEALRPVRDALRPGDLVLVKGSRAVGLERLAEGLRKR